MRAKMEVRERTNEFLATRGSQKSGGSTTDGALGSFVWKPGGVAGGNTFTSWATLAAAVMATQGLTTILVDTSLGAAVIPVGVWNFGPEQRIDLEGSGFPVVTMADGASVSGLLRLANMELVTSGSVISPIHITTAATFVVLTLDNVSIVNGGAASAITVDGVGVAEIFLYSGGFITGTCLTTAGTATVIVSVDAATGINPTSMVQSGGSTLELVPSSPSASISPTQTGTITYQFVCAPGSQLCVPQASETTTQAERGIGGLIGTGVLHRIQYNPDAASAPAAGANSMVITVKRYHAGVLVGTVATATLNNANQMAAFMPFVVATGAGVTNATFLDGDELTVTLTVTGAVTLPTGSWQVFGYPLNAPLT
jgi:hypothetical protein